ncbi:MAG: phospho-N-acetylmuramoyl-pentapeptide-transferase [Thermomicrobiales bacterium]
MISLPLGLLPMLATAQASVMPVDPNENMAVSLALASLAFIITIIIGRPYITFLRAKKVGKKIRLELQDSIHVGKAGTPTMGGLMFVASAAVINLVFNTSGRLSILLPVFVLIGTSVLGGVDDMMNIVGGKGNGMSGRIKMVWLMLLAVIAALILHLPAPYGLGLRHMYIPFLDRYDIGWLYVPVAVFAIVGAANAVNFTDGLDSLAGGTGAIAFCAYGIIAYRQGQTGVVTFCFIMVGALAGFLWFNAPPAQVIMGDAGSLAIGAALATAAFMTGQWLLLPVVGFVFVAEMVSVIIQVLYFKATKGKRFFRRTPIHHHFEMLGWSETQITIRFWLVGMMSGLLGVALALL